MPLLSRPCVSRGHAGPRAAAIVAVLGACGGLAVLIGIDVSFPGQAPKANDTMQVAGCGDMPAHVIVSPCDCFATCTAPVIASPHESRTVGV